MMLTNTMIVLLVLSVCVETVLGTTAKEPACTANSPIPEYFDDVYRTCLAQTVIGKKATGTDAYLNHHYFDENKRNLLYQCTKSPDGPKLSQTHEIQFEECYAREAGLRLKVTDEKAVAAVAFEQECGVVSELLSEYDCQKQNGEQHRVYKLSPLQQLKKAYDHCLPQHQQLIEKYFKCPDEADVKSVLFGIFKANPQISPAELKPLNDCFVAKATQQANFITKSKPQFETTYDVANLISVIRCKVSRMAAGGNAEKTIIARMGWVYSKFKDMFNEYAKWFANSYHKRMDCILDIIKPDVKLKTLFCTETGDKFFNCVPPSDHILIAGAYLDASDIRSTTQQANEKGWVAKDEKHASMINTKKGMMAKLLKGNPMATFLLKIIKKGLGWLKSKAGLVFCHKKYGILGKAEVGDLIKGLGGDPTKRPSASPGNSRAKRAYKFQGEDLILIAVVIVLIVLNKVLCASFPAYAAFMSHTSGWVIFLMIVVVFLGICVLGLFAVLISELVKAAKGETSSTDAETTSATKPA